MDASHAWHAATLSASSMQKVKDDVAVRKSTVGQFLKWGIDKGVFAERDFKEGEIVVRYSLRHLTDQEYQDLPEIERELFTHTRNGVIHLYPIPERYVNRSSDPNTIPDFDKGGDVALRDIRKGEEITIPKEIEEDF